jgi:hypothetical protein
MPILLERAKELGHILQLLLNSNFALYPPNKLKGLTPSITGGKKLQREERPAQFFDVRVYALVMACLEIWDDHILFPSNPGFSAVHPKALPG